MEAENSDLIVYKKKYYFLVLIINFLYITSSGFFILEIQNESNEFFTLVFVFIFGLICQYLCSTLNNEKQNKIVFFLRAIITGILLAALLISFLGLLNIFVIKDNYIVLKSTLYQIIKLNIPMSIFIISTFWISLGFSTFELILLYPTSRPERN